MIKNPELLILDEPLQGMDIEWREHFKQKIDMFSQNRTVLYVTHDQEEIPSGHWKTLQL
jgi:molybdate transport system ATP-binding protein